LGKRLGPLFGLGRRAGFSLGAACDGLLTMTTAATAAMITVRIWGPLRIGECWVDWLMAWVIVR